jgi:hypothetical protein
MKKSFENFKNVNNLANDTDQNNDSQVTTLAEEFFNDNDKAIQDYAEDNGLIFKKGKRWAIKMKKGVATYDPKFFEDKGYSEAESMWATCHEIEHFRDWRKNPETYSRLFSRMKFRRRIHVLYNCIDDIMVGKNTDKRFPSHIETRRNLYRDKLFKGADYTKNSKHLQLAYAILREKMLPEEACKLDSEVRMEIEKFKNIDGQSTDLIDLVSNPNANPKDRFEIIKDYIEPIFEKFFQKDVEEKKQQKKENSGDKNEDSEPQNPEDYFSDEYDDFDEKSPEPMPIEDIKKALDKTVKDKKEKTLEQIANEQFEKEHGVSVQSVENYRQDYEKIKQHIRPLREIFERIISKRKEIKKRLKERTDQGVILDPSLISQAYIDVKSGILDSRTQLKIRKEEFDGNKPNDFEFTLICDLSGSMTENQPGGKSYEQRLCAILILEALNEFEEKLKNERLEKNLDLHVFTETRGFGNDDVELKQMSDNIDYKTRVNIAQRLTECNGGSTKDFKSLAIIDGGITEEIRRKIEKNDLKKIVLLITDGGSDDVRQAKKEKDALTEMGVITKAIQIGEVDNSDKEKFKEVWKKSNNDGEQCKNVFQLVKKVEKLLEEFLSDI